jgi:hypothetical protein
MQHRTFDYILTIPLFLNWPVKFFNDSHYTVTNPLFLTKADSAANSQLLISTCWSPKVVSVCSSRCNRKTAIRAIATPSTLDNQRKQHIQLAYLLFSKAIGEIFL